MFLDNITLIFNIPVAWTGALLSDVTKLGLPEKHDKILKITANFWKIKMHARKHDSIVLTRYNFYASMIVKCYMKPVCILARNSDTLQNLQCYSLALKARLTHRARFASVKEWCCGPFTAEFWLTVRLASTELVGTERLQCCNGCDRHLHLMFLLGTI